MEQISNRFRNQQKVTGPQSTINQKLHRTLSEFVYDPAEGCASAQKTCRNSLQAGFSELMVEVEEYRKRKEHNEPPEARDVPVPVTTGELGTQSDCTGASLHISIMISSIIGTSSASKPSEESFSRNEIVIMLARLTPLSIFNLSIFFFNPTISINHYLCPKNLIEQILTLHDLHKRYTPNVITDGLQNNNCLPPQTRRTGFVILSI